MAIVKRAIKSLKSLGNLKGKKAFAKDIELATKKESQNMIKKTEDVSDEILDTSHSLIDRHNPEERKRLAKENQEYKDKVNQEHENKNKNRYSDKTNKPKESLDSVMFKKRAGAGAGENYMVDRVNKQLEADLNAMSDPLARKDIGDIYGIKDHEEMTGTQFKEAILDHHAQRIKDGPKIMDHMMGYKVPQTAAGLLVTAGVVSALSNSKGQQSNAQLYGQAPMPGM